jgi:condensin complex subunit 1
MSRAYDLLWLDIDNLGKYLATLLQKAEISALERLAALNATKMQCYAMIGTVKVIDQTIQAANEGMEKKKKRDMGCEEFENWDERRFKSLVQLYNLIQLPLEKLWDPPVPEESFVK